MYANCTRILWTVKGYCKTSLIINSREKIKWTLNELSPFVPLCILICMHVKFAELKLHLLDTCYMSHRAKWLTFAILFNIIFNLWNSYWHPPFYVLEKEGSEYLAWRSSKSGILTSPDLISRLFKCPVHIPSIYPYSFHMHTELYSHIWGICISLFNINRNTYLFYFE